jgi:hypothetical protein
MQTNKKVNTLRIENKSRDKINKNKNAYVNKLETRIKNYDQKASETKHSWERKTYKEQAASTRKALKGYKETMGEINLDSDRKKVKADLVKARRKANR